MDKQFLGGWWVPTTDEDGNISVNAVGETSDDKQICVTIATMGNKNSPSGEQILNTALLFAASKDLLESLEWILSKIPELKGDVSLFGMARCHNAVAKAKGGYYNAELPKSFE